MRTKICLLIALFWIGALATTQGQNPARREGAAGVPTFSRDVAPILYKHCASCHRAGEIAPMSLLTYEEARPWAKAIARKVSDRTMPPWHADAPAGTFHNERILTDGERQTLIDWGNGDAAIGNAGELPARPQFAEGWSLGKPDVVLEMQEDYTIPAQGTIEYEWLYIPTNFTEPKWVKSIEVRPGNRAAVHHVLVFYRATPDVTRQSVVRPNQKDQVTPRRRTSGERPPRTDLKEMPQRLIATYAPGTNPQVAPDGGAFRLEPGGILELQMHYTATGEATTDRSKVGMVFSKDPSPQEVRATHFFNGTFTLPAGAADVAVTTDLEFLENATVWGIFPHTHLRGKKWEYTLALPGGETRTVLAVPRYDFNWQTYYMFKEPLQVPRGAKLVSTAWYDNSAANKFNPDPKIDVKWGDQTWEEMQYTGVLFSPDR